MKRGQGCVVKYRDVEYTVVQGIGRQLWKWSIDESIKSGHAATKAEAVKEAERAIDRALAPNKLKLVRSDRD
jgi:glycogen synthase